MDSLKFLLYTLARIGLLIAVTAFAVLVGNIAYPALISLLPDGSTRDALMNETLRSAASFVIILAFLVPLFYDDGRKHAAYEIWSSVNITLTLIFMVLVGFVPSIFRDSFEPGGKANVFYEYAYFPHLWLQKTIGLDFVVSVLIGLALIAGIAYGAYLFSYKRYVKQHPVILGGPKRGETQLVEEEDESTGDVNLLEE